MPDDGRMKDILVLLETGPGMETEGLEHGLELARRHGARVHLLAAPAARPGRRTATESLSEAVEEALADLDTDDVELLRFEVTSGRPQRAVRSYATAHDVDLVVTCCGRGDPSTRRESDLRELRGRTDDPPVLSFP